MRREQSRRGGRGDGHSEGRVTSAALELEVLGAPRDVVDMAADARAVWLLSEHGAVHYSQLVGADTGCCMPT